MKYTNKHNVPQEIINAIHNDNYTKGEAIISVTGLLQPPQIRLLAKEHSDNLVILFESIVFALRTFMASFIVSSFTMSFPTSLNISFSSSSQGSAST